MPQYKERKLRGKVRQQIRWAIDDQSMWESEILQRSNFNFDSPKQAQGDDKLIRSRKKDRSDKSKYRNLELMD
jgi:hypothetical protein